MSPHADHTQSGGIPVQEGMCRGGVCVCVCVRGRGGRGGGGERKGKKGRGVDEHTFLENFTANKNLL